MRHDDKAIKWESLLSVSTQPSQLICLTYWGSLDCPYSPHMLYGTMVWLCRLYLSLDLKDLLISSCEYSRMQSGRLAPVKGWNSGCMFYIPWTLEMFIYKIKILDSVNTLLHNNLCLIGTFNTHRNVTLTHHKRRMILTSWWKSTDSAWLQIIATIE